MLLAAHREFSCAESGAADKPDGEVSRKAHVNACVYQALLQEKVVGGTGPGEGGGHCCCCREVQCSSSSSSSSSSSNRAVEPP